MLANGASYWLRPSFIFRLVTGTVDELAYPLLLADMVFPRELLKIGSGHNDMFSYRLIERLRRRRSRGNHPSATRHTCPSIWSRTNITPQLGPPRAAFPTTVGGGCILRDRS